MTHRICSLLPSMEIHLHRASQLISDGTDNNTVLNYSYTIMNIMYVIFVAEKL
jgi:hypothetical protein